MCMNTSTKLERSSHAFWSPVIPTGSPSDNAIVVKTRLEDTDKKETVVGHIPESLAQSLGPMLKDGTVHSIVAKITGEKRRAPEVVWVQGGGIELPCEYVVYGLKTTRQRVKHELWKL